LKKLQKIRNSKFGLQGGRCFYCCQPMWCGNPADFADTHGLRVARTRYLQATAEHLVARSEGGTDTPDNIVAACWFCNTHRHRTKRPLAPEAYAREVCSRLGTGGWHGFRLVGAGVTRRAASE
jgi:5-methylcytosine-specific restriction endonuclease McrA